MENDIQEALQGQRGDMMTYCRAEMKFIDVTALSDATPSTNDNQSIGNIELFEAEYLQKDYGTTELNQFVLSGEKSILPEEPEDIAFWSEDQSKSDCTFEDNPKLKIQFTAQHSSAGISLYFVDDYPAELVITWYTVSGVKLISKTFYPDNLIYVCSNPVQNYGRIEIEFVRTAYPERYVKLQYILYGKYIVWDQDMVQSGKVQEDIDVTSATLPINKADLSIVDVNNDFDIGNEDGAWKSIQKTQEVNLAEFRDGEWIPIGAFYVDDFSFSNNIATFKLIDGVGLMDKYIFYDGQIYQNVKAGDILRSVFAAAGIMQYSIEDEVEEVMLTGYLGVQTCRKALQRICFACGAVADDSRSDTIKVYKPDRYVSSTVGLDRKFNGHTKVALDKYVSGVSIECKRYALEEKTSDIYKGSLQAGETRITFSEPYQPESITAAAGTIQTVKTNYLVIHMETAGECVISGRKYANAAFTYQKNVPMLEAGETENPRKFTDCTLYNADRLPDVADSLLSYYALRQKVDMKYLEQQEQVGNWINIEALNGRSSTTLVESQSVDLTGGYIATAKCRGYSAVVTDLAYTREFYAGERGLI